MIQTTPNAKSSAAEIPLVESLQREPGLPAVHVRRPRALPPDRALPLRLRIGPRDPLWENAAPGEPLFDVRTETQVAGEIQAALSDFMERHAVDGKHLDLPPGVAGPAPSASVRLLVEITGLRNNKGVCAVTLFHSAAGFPGDSQKATGSMVVPIQTQAPPHRAVSIFADIPPGIYAIGLLHDENANGKLDTFLGIPREGFGFSGGGVARTGPPKFDACRFVVSDSSPIRRVGIPTTYLTR